MSADDPFSWGAFREIACEALTAVLDAPVVELAPEDHLLDDVGLDSFGLLLFATELEDRLGVELAPSTDEPTAATWFRLVSAAQAQRRMALADEGRWPS